MFEVAFTYLVAINAVAFLAFAIDKLFAEQHRRRIPERTLLVLAAIGGASGGLVGQQLLRHKTRKQAFRGWLLLIVLAQAIIVVAWALYALK
jgi:uncharacterized membrane protein YsdA (DUF1294 family)